MAVSENLEPSPPNTSKALDPPVRRRSARWWMILAGVTLLGAGCWFGGRYLWASYHLRAAQRALARYDFSEAQEEFERCLRIWPKDAGTLLQAARAARRAGRLDQAEDQLAACEKLGLIPAQTALERAMLRAQRGDLAEVEMPLNELIRNNHPDTVLILEALAHGYVQAARHGHALAMIDMLIQREPEDPEAYFLRGSIVEERSRIEALPDYQHAFQLAPHQFAYRLRLAEALVRYSQPVEAWPHFEELLKQSPHDAAVLFGAARCLRALAREKEAMEYLDSLLHDHPEHAEGWAERGRIYSDQRDRAEAIRCLRKAFDLEPTSHTIGMALFTELYADRQVKEADAVRAIVERLQRDAKRLLELTQQLATQERNAALRHEVGLIYLRNKVDAEALRWFFAALQDDPAYRPTHAVLADYFERIGNAAAAEYHRERAGKAPP